LKTHRGRAKLIVTFLKASAFLLSKNLII